MLITLAQKDATFWMPEQASTFSHVVDGLFYFIYWVSLFSFVLIGGVMFYFAWKYRRRDPNDTPGGSHHNNSLEVTWTVIPSIVLVIIFVWGFRGYRNLAVAPANSYEVLVTASQWSWSFTYPNGLVSNELHIPADRSVKFVLESTDVIHAFFVPQFRTKKDIVPGRHNEIWLRAPRPGTYVLYCAEYCGTLHSNMKTTVHVEPVGAFIAWVDKDPTEGKSLSEAGEILYQIRGCKTCHTIDGSAGIGPSFLDLYGRDEVLRGGETVRVNEEYIYESIKDPGARIVAGFQDQMPPLPVKDKGITKIIAFLKSISKHYTGDRHALFKAPEPAEESEDTEAGGDQAEKASSP